MKNIFKFYLLSRLFRTNKGRGGCGCFSLIVIAIILYLVFGGGGIF